jgi:uncharacterized membrane protein (GlpM family)
MTFLPLILKFVVGGLVVVGATLLTKYVNPKLAGLLVAAPLTTLITFAFISIENKVNTVQSFLISSVYFMIPSFLFLFGIYVASFRFSLLISTLIGAVVFLITIVIMYILI